MAIPERLDHLQIGSAAMRLHSQLPESRCLLLNLKSDACMLQHESFVTEATADCLYESCFFAIA